MDVSVIIPTYNRSALLELTLKSIGTMTVRKQENIYKCMHLTKTQVFTSDKEP